MNIIPYSKSSAATLVVDKPEAPLMKKISGLWRLYRKDKTNHQVVSDLADHLDHYLRETFPSETLSGSLKGMEAEIRSDTLQLLLSRYLDGRPKLNTQGSNQLIAAEMKIAVRAAWSISCLTAKRNLKKQFNEMHLDEEGWSLIPDQTTAHSEVFWELHLDERIRLTELAIDDAEKRGKASPATARDTLI